MSVISSINNNLIIFLSQLNDSNPDFSGLATTVVAWLNAFIIPVSVIVGGLSMYKLMSLGWKIAHSSDQPEERRIAILALVWWAVGLILCIAAPVLINVLIPALMKATGSGGYVPPKT